jgi:hypothetical protein
MRRKNMNAKLTGIVMLGLWILLAGCAPLEAQMAAVRLGAGPVPPGSASVLPQGWAAPVKTAPAIDGKLDEAAWKQARPLKMRPVLGHGQVGAQTRVLLLHDREHVYIGVRLYEPKIDELRRAQKGRDGRAYADDSVELWLQPKRRVYQFAVGAGGALYDASPQGQAGWNAKARSGVHVGAKSWSLELAIPLSDLGVRPGSPGTWRANFYRSRHPGGGEYQAWSPTGKHHFNMPERFGFVKFGAPPKAKRLADREPAEVRSVPNGEAIVRFDLSVIPKGARVFRADLLVSRNSIVDGRMQEARTNVEVFPLFTEVKEDEPAKLAGKPLAIRPPWYDRIDATEAVQRWVKGAANGGFFVRACPFFNAEATALDVCYEGPPGDVPQQVTDVKAVHRSGQTFLTWKEITEPVGKDEVTWGDLKGVLDGLDRKRRIRYCVYRSARPITAKTLHRAERIAEVRPLSCWNVHGRNVERGIDWHIANRYALIHGHWNPFCRASMDGPFGRDCPMDRLVIEDGADPLARGTGLYVHTAAKPGKAYYAVVTAVDGVQNTRAVSSANTAGPVAETPGRPQPVLQKEFPRQPYFNYRETRLHYVRWVAPPYTNRPSDYYNWSVAVPTVKLGETHPLELSLHRDDRSYWRTQYRIERDSIIVTPHDFPRATWWYGYHESLGTLKSFRQGVVQPYTERRVLSFVDWVAKTWPVDRARVFVTSVQRRAGGAGPSGRGGGCSGALHLAFRHPDVFNLCLPGHGVRADYAGEPRPSMMAIWGQPEWKLADDTGANVWDALDLVDRVRSYPAARELPMVTFTGRKVPKRLGEFIAAVLEKGGATKLFFDRWSGPKLIPVSASGAWPGSMVRLDVRRDRLMPAFGRSQAAAFREGKVTYTRLNLGYRWRDDVVDMADRAALTIWRGRRSDKASDITLRRAQNFKPKPGAKVTWKLGEVSGEATVGEDGVLTLPNVPIPTEPTQLVVTAN